MFYPKKTKLAGQNSNSVTELNSAQSQKKKRNQPLSLMLSVVNGERNVMCKP